jgi:hypothetical protein
MKPRSIETADLVAHFKAGLSVYELATQIGWPILKVEQAIRRWMIRYPRGRKP